MNLAIPCVRGAAAVRDLRDAIFYRVVFCSCVFAVARIVARYGIFCSWFFLYGLFAAASLYGLFAAAFGRRPSFSGGRSFCSSIAGRLPLSSFNIISTIYLF